MNKILIASAVIFFIGIIFIIIGPAQEKQELETSNSVLTQETSNTSQEQRSVDASDVKIVLVDSEQSMIAWRGKAVGKAHDGAIKIKSGKINLQNGEIVGGHIVIDMSSITNNDLEGVLQEKLIIHLKSDDFFGVATYPEAQLSIVNVEKDSDTGFAVVSGDLTIKGVTQPITFIGKTKVENGNVQLESDISLDRTLWDVKFGSEKFIEKVGAQIIDDMIDLKLVLIGKVE